jgi:hypothetical protein
MLTERQRAELFAAARRAAPNIQAAEAVTCQVARIIVHGPHCTVRRHSGITGRLLTIRTSFVFRRKSD